MAAGATLLMAFLIKNQTEILATQTRLMERQTVIMDRQTVIMDRQTVIMGRQDARDAIRGPDELRRTLLAVRDELRLNSAVVQKGNICRPLSHQQWNVVAAALIAAKANAQTRDAVGEAYLAMQRCKDALEGKGLQAIDNPLAWWDVKKPLRTALELLKKDEGVKKALEWTP
ncbi:MAG: hypothetical protein ISS78_06105 [Phycisphaerae bacterium]|nr:hypothetical protein [Phycisphaerae bacterium]